MSLNLAFRHTLSRALGQTLLPSLTPALAPTPAHRFFSLPLSPASAHRLPSLAPAPRSFHSTPSASDEKRIPENDEAAAAAAAAFGPASQIPVTGERTPIAQIQQRLSITFTCSVDECGHRSTHEFAKRSYTHGIVIVQCPGCKNRHLIADNLSWFTETADEPKTIEEMIAAKGGKVRRGTVFSDGKDGETIEIEG
ncbi:hypothetical protein ACQY0O_000599 [Thecaphora frezii]